MSSVEVVLLALVNSISKKQYKSIEEVRNEYAKDSDVLEVLKKYDKESRQQGESRNLSNQLWRMELNAEIVLPGNVWIVTRVPGGWIYSRSEDGGPAVFVPKDNEFLEYTHTGLI